MSERLTAEQLAEVRKRDEDVPWTAVLAPTVVADEYVWQALDDRHRLLATLDAERDADLRKAAIDLDDAINRWMERHWTKEYPFQAAEKALHKALYGHERGSAISPCRQEHAAQDPA